MPKPAAAKEITLLGGNWVRSGELVSISVVLDAVGADGIRRMRNAEGKRVRTLFLAEYRTGKAKS